MKLGLSSCCSQTFPFRESGWVVLPLKASVLQQIFPGGSHGNASPYSAGDLGLIPRSGRSPGEGNGNPLQYFCLENPLERGAWQATVHGVTKSQTRLSDFILSITFIWENEEKAQCTMQCQRCIEIILFIPVAKRGHARKAMFVLSLTLLKFWFKLCYGEQSCYLQCLPKWKACFSIIP